MKLFSFLLVGFVLIACQDESAEESSEKAMTEEPIEDTLIVEDEWTPPSWDLESIQFQKDFEGCLPAANQQFLAWKKSDSLFHYFPYDYDNLYMYLSTHVDSSSTKIVTEQDSIWGVISWEQYFSGGIKYESIYHPEAGSSTVFQTNCSDIDFLRTTLFPIIENDENYWNEDSTAYGPDGAGCYYDFNRDSVDQTIVIDNYCGC